MPIPTRGTNSEEIKPMGHDAISARGLRARVKPFVRLEGNILDLSALLAYYMVVRAYIGVKPIDAASRTEHSYLPPIREKGEIPIHGTEAKRGEFRLKPLIEPRGRRVALRRTKQPHDRRSLPRIP
jgi:hypothetical protein